MLGVDPARVARRKKFAQALVPKRSDHNVESVTYNWTGANTESRRLASTAHTCGGAITVLSGLVFVRERPVSADDGYLWRVRELEAGGPDFADDHAWSAAPIER